MSLRLVTLLKVSFRKVIGKHERDFLGCRKVCLLKGRDAKSSLLAEFQVFLSAHENIDFGFHDLFL